MNERELNTLFNIVTEPEQNAYKLDSVKKMQEIQRIVRVLEISKAQKESFKQISARGLVAFKMLVSNN
ncbi:MAG: hypothetical protein OSJ27_03455 [Candidatus Gastranaerophilales bacterium]|nr:hypothetical protein [Candidatus Gastranaerophilales bacterium]